jgi:protein gp37
MAAPLGQDAWWDESYTPFGGCLPVSPGCQNCYAAQIAGTKTWPFKGSAGVHNGVTVVKGKRRIFNGKITAASDWHAQWTWPLRWKGATHPKLGVGAPSLIFVGDMSDLFYKRPDAIITRVCATLVQSDHIGLLLTKRTRRMAEYFGSLDPRTVKRWQPKLWLGFSAESQECFDRRWADMCPLTGEWHVFVSIAPMIGPVMLPDSFTLLGPRVWVIVAGEQGPHDRCRDMDPRWARSVRDQCAAAHVPLFVKQMAKGAPIPPDLQIRGFPSVAQITRC